MEDPKSESLNGFIKGKSAKYKDFSYRASMEGYNLDTLLKKKRKNLYNRMHAAGKNVI